MDEETSRLRALLAELHLELSRQPPAGIDDARRGQLLELKADVERLLPPGDAAGTDSPTPVVAPEQRRHLQGRLQELLTGFEGAHPQLASVVEQTMNALSNMGL